MGWFFGTTAILIAPILLAMYVWRRNKRLDKCLYEHKCPLCATSFEDTLPSVIGPVSKSEMEILDNFQKRFAGSSIRCEACGGIVICSKEGFPMKGYYQKETSPP